MAIPQRKNRARGKHALGKPYQTPCHLRAVLATAKGLVCVCACESVCVCAKRAMCVLSLLSVKFVCVKFVCVKLLYVKFVCTSKFVCV